MESTAMDEATYKVWWPLHIRAAKGESLTSDERAFYEMWLKRLHEEEKLDTNLDEARAIRESIKALETERSQLEERRRKLQERAALLEAALSKQAKQTLGVGD
jgi:hypothetical protein